MNDLTILYEDKHILVCEKPTGIPVQTRKTVTPDMESLLKNHLRKEQPNFPNVSPYLAVIHRLDQPVSGVMVFAKTPSAAAHLSHQLQKHGFSKKYQSVLCGTLPQSAGSLTHYLVKDGRTNTSRVCSKETPQAKLAQLSYEIVDRISTEETPLSIVNIHLKTGRHHQIRVQMAASGAPLWGDNKYNPAFTSKQGYHPIALRAYKLEFDHPTNHKKMSFELPCHWDYIFSPEKHASV